MEWKLFRNLNIKWSVIDMGEYIVFDIETTYGEWNGRVGSRWNKDCAVCSAGFADHDSYEAVYLVKDGKGTRPEEGLPFPDLSGINVLVGHNIKFDNLWYWDHPLVQQFLARGGRVWDTMYAEYLLSAAYYSMNTHDETLGLSLKSCAVRRNLTHQKQDIVSAMWEEGIRTEDVPEHVLMEYMKFDILTTKDLYIAQLAQAKSQGQLVMIQQRMEGLVATTEMEFNGLEIDMEEAERQMETLRKEIAELREGLQIHVPALPEGCEFNWNSSKQLSALLFGGDLKYKAPRPSLDENGNKQYYKKTTQVPVLDENGNPVIIKSGKNKGLVKTNNVSEPDYERGCKTKLTDLIYTLPRQVEPKDKWKSATEGYWSVGADVLEELKSSGIVIIKDILRLKGAEKDLGTYYMNEVKGKMTGMLTNIQELDGRVHGHLNHAITATTRLSSSRPNLQNMPKKGKSNVKRLFKSRFPQGVVCEIDYSQLEVVTKAVLSGDVNLLLALRNGVDFHCDWLSLATGVPYETVVHNCKVLELPDWKDKRSKIKPVTFGHNYGAGLSTLCESSGLSADVLRKAMDSHKEKYPQVYEFDERVVKSVHTSRQTTTSRTKDGYTAGIGFFRSCTDTIYSFLEIDAMAWQRDQGIMTAFSPTVMKNYPSQGLGGEITQVQSGRVARKLYEHGLNTSIIMFNNVHDAVYFDFETEALALEYIPKISALLEDVTPYFNKTYKNTNWETEFPVEAMYGLNLYETKNVVHERDTEWCVK